MYIILLTFPQRLGCGLVSKRGEANTYCICMSIETFAIRKGGDYRTQHTKTVARELLRSDTLLERECVDTAELARVPVRW